LALKKECPSCHYRNSSKAKKCKKCGRPLSGQLSWWVDINSSKLGKRFVKKAGSYEEAKQLEAKIKAEIHQKKKKQSFQEIPTLEEFWPQYLAHCISKNKDIRNKKSRWKNHIEPAFGKYRLDEITPTMVEDYRNKRLKHVKPATVNREVSLLKNMLSMARKWGLIKYNPLAEFGSLPERNENTGHALTHEEAKKLLENTNPYYRDFFEFLLYTGRRVSEALNLRWRDFNPRQKTVLVRDSKNGSGFYFPLTQQAFEILVRLFKKAAQNRKFNLEERIFTHDASRARKELKQALEKAGLPNTVRLHDLRHTFGTWCADAGLSTIEIQYLMGHKTMAMVKRYVHPASTTIKNAANKLSEHIRNEAQKENDLFKLLDFQQLLEENSQE